MVLKYLENRIKLRVVCVKLESRHRLPVLCSRFGGYVLYVSRRKYGDW
jgi:hypothetical protein